MVDLDDYPDRIAQAIRRGHYRVQPNGGRWASKKFYRHTDLAPDHPDRGLTVIVTWTNASGGKARTRMSPYPVPVA